MILRPVLLFLSLCMLCGAASAAKPADKQEARLRKEREKSQKKEIRREIRRYASVRNEAVLDFAARNPPAEVEVPSALNELRVSKVVCAGDNITGTVVLHFYVTPLLGSFRIYMGGEDNGTRAYARGNVYPSADHYGRIYTLRSGQPELITVLFYNIAPGIDRLDRVDVSLGLELNLLNMIRMKNVPVYWTYTDKAIGNFVRSKAEKNAGSEN